MQGSASALKAGYFWKGAGDEASVQHSRAALAHPRQSNSTLRRAGREPLRGSEVLCLCGVAGAQRCAVLGVWKGGGAYLQATLQSLPLRRSRLRFDWRQSRSIATPSRRRIAVLMPGQGWISMRTPPFAPSIMRSLSRNSCGTASRSWSLLMGQLCS